MQTATISAANILSVMVSVTNTSGRDMSDVRWGVGFDPDQGIPSAAAMKRPTPSSDRARAPR